MLPVEIHGRSVVLRDFRTDDLDDAVKVVGDEAVTKWLSFSAKSRAETESMISGIIERSQRIPRTEYYLAVTLPHNGPMIGFARIGLDGTRAGKLGYAISAAHQGRGYATDAAAAMTHFAFSTLELHRVSAAIGPDNASSIAVVEKLGFLYEGRIRDHVFTNGAWRDSLLYSILDYEWDNRPPA